MSFTASLFLLALAAWSAHTGSALAADLVTFATLGLFWPLVCMRALGVLLLDTRQIEQMTALTAWRGESALRWLALVATLVCLLHAGHGGTAGALWLGELVALATKHAVRWRLAPRGRGPA